MDYIQVEDIHEISLLYDSLEESFYNITNAFISNKTGLEKTYVHRLAQIVKILAKSLKCKQKNQENDFFHYPLDPKSLMQTLKLTNSDTKLLKNQKHEEIVDKLNDISQK